MNQTYHLICLLLALILSNQSQAGTALNGDYTIGGVSPDYVTINLAVADLVSNGISGPVNFLMRGGTYNEQVTITAFQRFGLATDQVTFTKSGPAQGVNWIYTSVSAGSPWILKLDDADYITFSDLAFHSVISGFGDMIYFEGGSHNITIERNAFDGQFGVGNLIFQNTFGNHHSTRFISNTFSQGEIAIDLDYIFGGADSTGVEIYDNIFTNQSSKSVEAGTDGLIIYDNTVSTGSTSNSDFIGFDIMDRGPQIENNTFDLLKGNVAIKAEGDGVAVEGRIINNMIALRDSNAITAGMHVDIENVSIYHNTVRSASSVAPALLIQGGAEVRIQNNILINAGGGIALTILNQSLVDVSDYNDIYSTGNPLVRVNGTSYNSLASYKLNTGLDTNSIEQSVSFVNTVGVNDLHLSAPNNNDVDFLAPLIAGVITDFDGDSRGTISVYKGSDEGVAFVPLDNADTVSGYYTVAGSNPDYTTPSAAITDLKQRGMKGSVTFRIRAGFYTTHQTIAGINRTGNPDDLLLFRADDFNNPPTLRYNTNSVLKNWVIKIQDMGDISFDHINFSTSAAGIFGNLLVIEGDSDTISVRDGTFTGVSDLSVDTAALILATEQSVDNYEFINNQFINGSIALNLMPSAVFTSPRGNRLIVETNTFTQQGLHALLTNHDDIDFNGNDVSNTLNNFVALYIQFNRDTQINKNKFLLTGSSSIAINLKGADGATVANPNVFSNNFIKSETGIDLNTGSHTIEMYYNTIVASVSPVTIQDGINDSHDIKLLNNILFNNGSGAAIFVAPDAEIEESNFNNFINGSGDLFDWQGTQYTSLSAFQNATSFDPRSTNTPVFFSSLVNADFHLVLSSIGSTALTGAPLSLVVDDYDSDTRTLASPYMGADQVVGNPIINTYSIGGSISGLASSNTVNISNSNGDVLLNQTNGGFTFSIDPDDGDAYNVTVSSQPTIPDQTCSVANGSGILSGENITDINIVCQTNFYSIGGTVTGLTPGNTLSLQNNIADNTVLSDNGAYTFSTLVENGNPYSVTVLSLPGNPHQSCSISNAAATVSNGNVTNANVNCVTETYSVGGSVLGLTPGNSVELQNNNSNNLIVSGNGGFTFTEELDSNSNYSVTVLNQPNNPLQTCVVTNGTGDINVFNIANVQISCSTDTFTIGGTVTGLVSGSSFTLQANLNGTGEIQFILDNGSYSFPNQLQSGVTYDVTVLAAPGTNNTYPYQLCSISNATGVISGENITNIDINCVIETFSVGGSVSGLAKGNSVEIQNNKGDNLLINSNGIFAFIEELDSTNTYAVSVLNQPSTPEQDCTVTNEVGDINITDITNVHISCSTDVFSIGGTVTGLIGGNSITLQNNNTDDEVIFSDGIYAFSIQIEDEDAYSVTVLTQPSNPNQLCSVSNATAMVSGESVTNVNVNCVTENFSVGGSVSGLAPGNSVELQNNNINNLLVSSNGGFTFTTELDSNSSYVVSVLNQPSTPEQDCTVTNATGDINTTDITNVQISCTSDEFTIGGAVTGLVSGNSVVLRNNGGDDLEVFTNGDYTFTTPLDDGLDYSVTVFTHPTSPNQTCLISNGSNMLNGFDVTNVNVICDNLDMIYMNDFETIVMTTEPNQTKIETYDKTKANTKIKTKNGNTNNITNSGTQVPQVIPSLNFMGLMLMVFGFLMVVKIRYHKRYRLF